VARSADRLRAAGGPRIFLAALVLAQLCGTIAFATNGPIHNGWAFYQGGDQIWLATSSELLAGLHMPSALVGYGWPFVLIPILGLLGPDYVSALPAVVVLGLLLAPIATWLVYRTGELIGGRAMGMLAATAWVAAPFVSLLLFADRYHDRWVDQFLPQFTGLTAMADYPSMILLIGVAYLVLRSLEAEDDRVAILAGLVMGFAAATKPANLVFLLGPVLAYLLAWRLRPAVVSALAMLPSLATLAIWKQRGLGSLPILTLPEEHVAAGTSGPVVGTLDVGRYLDFDWDLLSKNISDLDAVLWGSDALKILPLVGLVVIGRLCLPAAGLLIGWLVAFVVVKGANGLSTVDSGSFFRLLMPSWPAYVMLVAAAPLLVTALRRRRDVPRRDPPQPIGRRALWTAGVLLAALPFLVVVASRPIEGPDRVVHVNSLPVPVTDRLHVHVEREPSGRTTITWEAQHLPARVFYRVFRSTSSQDTNCETTGADECHYDGELLATTRSLEHVDGSPPGGSTYRIGVGTNAFDDDTGGDVFLLSAQAD
jgi:hypothetical protein